MEQPISTELLQAVNFALSASNKWVAYNQSLDFLDKKDVFFFNGKEEAIEFANNNKSDVDRYHVSRISSLKSAIENAPDIPKYNIQSHIKSSSMNTQNLDYLKDNLKYLGFGEKLYPELEKKIQQGLPEFSLKLQNEYGRDKLEAQLHFRRSDQSDMYFFNRYEAKLQAGEASQNQTFYINKGSGVTMKEAYNLMSGRAVNKDLVNKEGQVYNAWMQIDFKETESNGNYKIKQYHQNYGYNLEKALIAHPIKELANEQDKARLLESLNKGNRQAVTIVKEGTELKHFVEANPKFKSVNVYDSNMQRIMSKQAAGEKHGQGNETSIKAEGKQASRSSTNDADEGPDFPEASKKRGKKQGQSIS